MRAICNGKEFTHSVKKVLVGTTRREAEYLKGIMIDCFNGFIDLIATNIDVTISARIPADVKEAGIVLVDGKELDGMMGYVTKKEQDIELHTDDDNLIISCENKLFMISQMNAKPFPKQFETYNGVYDIAISPKELYTSIEQTLRALSMKKPTKGYSVMPYSFYVMFEKHDGKLKLVASDGYRLSIKHTQYEIENEEWEQELVLAKNLKVVKKILKISKVDTVFIRKWNEHIIFGVDNVSIAMEIQNFDFPNCAQIIPKNKFGEVVVDKQSLIKDVEEAKLCNDGIVKLIVSSAGIMIELDDKAHKFEKAISAENIDNDITIKFYGDFLIDGLKAIEEDKVVIEFYTSKYSAPPSDTPVILHGLDNTNYTYMVMPR